MDITKRSVKALHRGRRGASAPDLDITSPDRDTTARQSTSTAHQSTHQSAARGSRSGDPSTKTAGTATEHNGSARRWATLEDRAPNMKRPFPSDSAYFLG